MTEEFTEGRESELGDLPDSLLKAREEQATDNQEPEFIPPGANIMSGRASQGIPMDIAREARILKRPGEIGSVTLPYGVTSTYDGRPINARDFLVTKAVSFTVAAELEIATVEANYTIPGGFIGVWRGFGVEPGVTIAYSLDDQQTGYVFTSIKYTLLINDVVVPDYENMALGQVVNNMDLKTWVLGLEQQTFTVRIIYDQTLGDIAVGDTNDMFFNVHFYGQNLLTRGLPLPFEIASQEATGSVRT
jgi:hypothetical protein